MDARTQKRLIFTADGLCVLCEGCAAAFFIKGTELVTKCEESKEFRGRVFSMGNIVMGVEMKTFLGADVDEERCSSSVE